MWRRILPCAISRENICSPASESLVKQLGEKSLGCPTVVPEYGLPIVARSIAAAQDEPKSYVYGEHASAVVEPSSEVEPAGQSAVVLGVSQ